MAVTKQRRVSRAELVFKRLQHAEPAKILGQLRSVAQVKKFKSGWVKHKFKAIFNRWPSESSEPQEPCSDLLTWLERERRNYGQRMKRQEEKAKELSKAQSELILVRIESILAELEANPLVLEPCCQEDTDGEALDTVCRIVGRGNHGGQEA